MWEGTNRRWWSVVQKHILARLQADGISSESTPENLQQSVISNPSEEEDDLASVETEDDFIPEDHDVDRLFDDVVDDMNFLTGLLSRIYRLFYADELANEPNTQQDDKLQQLLKLLKNTPMRNYSSLLNFAILLVIWTSSCSALVSEILNKLIAEGR